MRYAPSFLAAALVVSLVRLAHAQEVVVEPPAPAASPARVPAQPTNESELVASKARTGPPEPRKGFQLGMRTGYAIPMGKLADTTNGDVSNYFSGQVPFLFDIGAKVHPNLFLGGYVGFGFGGAAGDLQAACDRANTQCVAASFRVGIEILANLLPAGRVNPWVGYGIGIESLAFVSSNDVSLSTAGPEYARFMAGVDFRLSRTVGLGPVVDYSIGQYATATLKVNGRTVEDGEIANKAGHQWLTLGIKLTLFP